MNKIYEITPSGNNSFDTLIVICTKDTWGEVIDYAESILDDQLCSSGKFDGIEVKIKCREVTDDELAELEEDHSVA